MCIADALLERHGLRSSSCHMHHHQCSEMTGTLLTAAEGKDAPLLPSSDHVGLLRMPLSTTRPSNMRGDTVLLETVKLGKTKQGTLAYC